MKQQRRRMLSEIISRTIFALGLTALLMLATDTHIHILPPSATLTQR